MWIPESAEQIIEFAENHKLNETNTFDAKAPAALDSTKEIAKDIAAMSTDGGVILYGVGEDEHGNPTVPEPFDLEGAEERISNVVQTCIQPPPEIDPRPFILDKTSSEGFLAVRVPRSQEAPHMVTKSGDSRFYGRNGPRNVRLGAREVERLFERRRRLQQDRKTLLSDLKENATIKPEEEKSECGYLRLALKPATRREQILESLLSVGDPTKANRILTSLIRESEEEISFSWGRGETFITNPTWTSELNGYSAELGSAGESMHTRRFDVWVGLDGGMYFNAGGVVTEKQVRRVFLEGLAVKLSTKILYFAGLLFERAGYRGPVNIATRLTGLEGASSGYLNQGAGLRANTFKTDKFESDTQTRVYQLVENPRSVVDSLLRRVIDHSTRGSAEELIEGGASD